MNFTLLFDKDFERIFFCAILFSLLSDASMVSVSNLAKLTFFFDKGFGRLFSVNITSSLVEVVLTFDGDNSSKGWGMTTEEAMSHRCLLADQCGWHELVLPTLEDFPLL